MGKEKIILFLGFTLFSVSFFLFYPQNYGIVDEAAYLSTSYTLTKGKIFYDQAGITKAPMMVIVNGHYVSKYPPGNSILLLPFTIINWRLVFLRGYLLMALGFLLFTLILSHYQLPQFYSLLFLFHPSLILYSRTMMSDMPATLFILAAFYFFIKKNSLLSGIFIGIGIAIRYSVLLIPFTICVLLLGMRNWKNLLWFLVGVIIGIIPLLVYHFAAFHKLVGLLVNYGDEITLQCFGGMFKEYFLSLNILYPFLLVLPFMSKIKEKWLFIIPGLIFLLFYCLQGFIDHGDNFFESLVQGQRYMLPIIPLLLVPYIAVIDKIKLMKKITRPIAAVLFIASIIIQYKHQQFLTREVYYQNRVYQYATAADLVICNKEVYELINPYIKYIAWEPFELQGHPFLLNSYKNTKMNIYLICIARTDMIKQLFRDVCSQFPFKKEIYNETVPFYFSIWQASSEQIR